jgi:hypothetical protein
LRIGLCPVRGAGCCSTPRDRALLSGEARGEDWLGHCVGRDGGAWGGWVSVFRGPGGALLSRALRRSTIGAEGFHGRVRNGIGCSPLAMATRPSKDREDDGVLMLVCWRVGVCAGREFSVGLAAARGSKPIERLGPVSFMRCRTSTPGLSTWWSATALGETWFRGGFPA